MFGLSSSRSAQRIQTVSDQAQVVDKNAKVAQGQAVQVDLSKAKSANVGGLSFGNVASNAQISIGDGGAATADIAKMFGSTLQSLVGSMTAANAEQIAALTGASQEQINALIAGNEKQLDTLAAALDQKTEGETGNPKALLLLGVAAIVALAWLSHKKR